MPNSFATAFVDSSRRLQTATISTPGMARKPGMCRLRVLSPAPIRAMRREALMVTLRLLMSVSLEGSTRHCPTPRHVLAKAGLPQPFSVLQRSGYQAGGDDRLEDTRLLAKT